MTLPAPSRHPESANTAGDEVLALEGGEPIRSTPLPPPYYGALLVGDEERVLLEQVIQGRSMFRFSVWGQSRMVATFEKEVASYFGVAYALATATGSGSLFCALAALGIGPGDEVIIPAFGWYTVFNGPAHLGALPVLAEVNDSLNLDIRDVERKISPRTRAIIVIHFQGASYNIEELVALAKSHNLALVEDCAQCCGASVRGKKLGTFGDVGCFSMQENKLICTGDGGFLVTKDPELYERAIRYHDHGMVRKHFGTSWEESSNTGMIGLQFRMNELTGAVALAQLRKLDSHILDHTRSHHRKIRQWLEDNCPGIAFRPTDDSDGDAGIALYIRFSKKEAAVFFSRALAAEGIRVGPSSGCVNLTTLPLTQHHRMAHPAMLPFGEDGASERCSYVKESFPQTLDVLDRMVAVALTPQMNADDVADIGDSIAKVWRAMARRYILD